jgi:subtilisin family serine protease
MSRRLPALFVVAVAVLTSVHVSAASASSPPPIADSPQVRLVLDDVAVAEQLAERGGVTVVLETDLFAVVTAPAALEGELREAAADAGANVERDGVVRLADTPAYMPSDPFMWQWWGAADARLPQAWDVSRGTAGTVIAIVDTGVQPVAELAGRVLPGKSFFAGYPGNVDPDGHGTMSATVAAGAADNGIGAAGVCPRCVVLPVMVFEPGKETGSLSTIAAGIVWAADNGADVISLSLGGPTSSTALSDAVNYAASRGAVVVAAAGNYGEQTNCAASPCATTPLFPAALPGVISVAAANEVRSLYSWSSRWQGMDLSAPGCNIAVDQTAATVWYCGTSSATPFVAGAAALYRSVAPSATPGEVNAALAGSAKPGSGLAPVSWGALDAADLLASAPSSAFPQAPFTDVARPSFYAAAVDWAFTEGVTTGVAATLFGVHRPTTRAEVVTFLWRVAGRPAPQAASPFSDVPAGVWFDAPTAWAVEQGVTTGTAPGQFSPQRDVTRAEIVTFLWRFAGRPSPQSPSPFSDVPSGAFFAAPTAWAVEQGVTTGTSATQFSPQRSATRAETVTFLWRSAGKPLQPSL